MSGCVRCGDLGHCACFHDACCTCGSKDHGQCAPHPMVDVWVEHHDSWCRTCLTVLGTAGLKAQPEVQRLTAPDTGWYRFGASERGDGAEVTIRAISFDSTPRDQP